MFLSYDFRLCVNFFRLCVGTNFLEILNTFFKILNSSCKNSVQTFVIEADVLEIHTYTLPTIFVISTFELTKMATSAYKIPKPRMQLWSKPLILSSLINCRPINIWKNSAVCSQKDNFSINFYFNKTNNNFNFTRYTLKTTNIRKQLKI